MLMRDHMLCLCIGIDFWDSEMKTLFGFKLDQNLPETKTLFTNIVKMLVFRLKAARRGVNGSA